MIKQNKFQAYRKKNKTKSSHCYVKHTVLTLLLLSPLESNAIDSTQKLRGKENNLGNLSYESIDSVIHVPDESGNIGLSTGEGESQHLSHIPHESSMLDEAKVQKHFFEQAKMASDKISTMNSMDLVPVGGACNFNDDCESNICEYRITYEPYPYRCVSAPEALMPNGVQCTLDEDCVSGRCSALFQCEDKVSVGDGCLNNDDCESNTCEWRLSCPPNAKCCVSAPGALMPNEARCTSDSHCNSGRCSSSFKCEDKLPNGESCGEDEDCASNYCPWSLDCGGIGCCEEVPPPRQNGESCGEDEDCASNYCLWSLDCGGIGCCEEGSPPWPVGWDCLFDDECLSGRCSSSLKCKDKLPNGESCGEDEDCASNYCPWSLDCGGIGCCEEEVPPPWPVGWDCLFDDECLSGRCSSSLKCKDKLPNGESCGEDEDCASNYCPWSLDCIGIGCCASPPPRQNGESCGENEDCASNYCPWSLDCGGIGCCASPEEEVPPPWPVGWDCLFDYQCLSGRCSSSLTCKDKLPNGESCGEDEDCESNYCPWSLDCIGIGCCASPEEEVPPPWPVGWDCLFDYQCLSGRCSSSLTCKDKLPNGESCGEDEDCESNYCPWSLDCGGIGCCASPSPSPKPKCFSSETLVTHSERGLIPISEIEVGDYVLDSKFDGSFSRVYALEQNHYGESAFYQLLSSTGTLLELTDRHMVYLKNEALPVPARDIQVGDVLKSDDPQNDMDVVEIKIIHRNGYYNPVTESGQIVLNDGVVASSFSVAKSSSSEFFDASTELIHWHTLSQLANAPLRFVCRVWSGFCADERFQNDEGLHKFTVLLKNASNLPKYQQIAVLPTIFGAGVLFTVLELMHDKAEALLEVASPTGAGVLTFSLVTALAVPRVLALRKRYFL